MSDPTQYPSGGDKRPEGSGDQPQWGQSQQGDQQPQWGDSYAAQSGDQQQPQWGDSYASQSGDSYAAQSGEQQPQWGDSYAAQSGDSYAAQSGDSYAAQSGDSYAAQSGDSYAAQSGEQQPQWGDQQAPQWQQPGGADASQWGGQQAGGWVPPAGAPGGPPPAGASGGGRGLAIATLVTGIVALLVALLPVILIPVIIAPGIGFVAIVLGIIALVKKQSKAMSIIGMVLGLIAPAVAFVMMFVWASMSVSGTGTTPTSPPETSIQQTEVETEAAPPTQTQDDPVSTESDDDFRPDTAAFPSFDMPTDTKPLGTQQDNGQGMRVTAISVREANDVNGTPPLFDRFVIVKVKIENYGAADYEFSQYDWELFESADVAFDPYTVDIVKANPTVFSESSMTIKVGQTVEIEIPYDLKSNSQPVVFAHGEFGGGQTPIGWKLN